MQLLHAGRDQGQSLWTISERRPADCDWQGAGGGE